MCNQVYGIVTDIQRFSLHDGPGIRTTVFLKGCNLSCLWCHNPETISKKKDILYYVSSCIGCGHCVDVCPSSAQKMIDGRHIFDRDLCISCGKCASVCYPGAMVSSGKYMTVEEVISEVIQDKAFYDESGGGVTISGGEVLCQMEFASAIIDACHEYNISVAVETNLSKPFDEIKDLLAKTDLIMMDIKLINNELHKKWTGQDNYIILDNIKKIPLLGVQFIVRTPLIPNVTDTNENLQNIAEFLKDVKGIQFYELLNFNPLGESKYRSLNRPNTFDSSRPLGQDRIANITELLSSIGVNVKIS
jgi:pyruvate formate lyase activating enzyme